MYISQQRSAMNNLRIKLDNKCVNVSDGNQDHQSVVEGLKKEIEEGDSKISEQKEEHLSNRL